MNRLGGVDIPGPGAVPQSGANPGRREHPFFPRPAMGATDVGKAVSIAGHYKSISILYPGLSPYGTLLPGLICYATPWH